MGVEIGWLSYTSSEQIYQLADIFTKALGQEKLDFLINKLGMRSMFPEMLKRLAEEEKEEIINQEEIQQAAREEKWVPKADRVNISSTNIRIDPTMNLKEETYQVILDVIKKTSFFKVFLASVAVPEIYMQQFCNTVTKFKESTFYEFKLANKKCLVDVEVFRQALNIFPRVPGKEFIVPPSEEELLTFLVRLGYKGVLTHLSQMLIDHMHQPWRTLASIINKCLSGKTISNGRLRQSRVAIIQGMFHKKRVIKKKVSISAYNNIIPEPDVTLEFGKSMSLTKAAEEEVARQVYATHERIVTEYDPEPARRRPSGIAFKDTSSMSKKMSPDLSLKLKGVQTLTPKEKLVADTMQALYASKKSSRSQPHAGGSSEGTSTKPGVPNESTIILTTSSEGTGAKLGVPYEEKVYSDEDEEKKNDDDDKSIDIEETDDEETDDKFVRGDEQVQENVDEEMKDKEVDDTGNGDEEITNTAKANAEKTKVVKDDNKNAELPPLSSNLSISSGFGNQFLNLSFDKSIVGTLKDSADAEIKSLLDVQIQKEIPQIQSLSILTKPILVISERIVLSTIPEILTVTSTTIPLPPNYVSAISPILLQQTTTLIPTPPITIETPPITIILDPLPAISQRVYVLEKDVQDLKTVNHTIALIALLRSKIPSAVNAYIGSKLGYALQKVLQKHTEELKHQYSQRVDYTEMIKKSVTVNKALEKTPTTLAQSSSQAQSSPKAAESLSKYKLKTILFEKMDKSRSYLTHDKHEALFDALFNSLSLDDAIAQKPVEEPVFEMALDDIEQTIDDVVNDADQTPYDTTQTKDK
ncbi:hypothetical protein Tco_0162690 [Tanacetum coccineum]